MMPLRLSPSVPCVVLSAERAVDLDRLDPGRVFPERRVIKRFPQCRTDRVGQGRRYVVVAH